MGADPQIRTTKNGVLVASLGLATDRSSGKAGATEWHRLTFWDHLAGLAEKYIRKGDRLFVEGRIRYTHSGEGEEKRYWTEIVVTNVIFLSPAKKALAGRASSAPDHCEGERPDGSHS